MRGTVSTDLFRAIPRASSGLIEDGILQTNAGRSLMVTGRGFIRGGAYMLAAQAAFADSYLATTGALCYVNPAY